MKKLAFVVEWLAWAAAVLATLVASVGLIYAGSGAEQSRTIAVYFSPHGGCTSALVKEIDAAKKTIYIHAYSFTSVPIAEAVLEAKHRGVKIEMLLDRSSSKGKGCQAVKLLDAKIPVRVNTTKGLAHSKIFIIDDDTIVTGSFNFSSRAESVNEENMLVIHDRSLVTIYLANWTNCQIASKSLSSN